MSDSGDHPAKVRILVLDEQPLLRFGISAYLNSQPDLVVCGEADSIPAAQRKIAECSPQLLLTSLRLGVGDSLGFVRTLNAEQPRLLVLVYSAFEESIFAERATRAGALGYVMKSAPSEELAAAIRHVVKGGIYVSRDLALSAFKKLVQQRHKNDHAPRSNRFSWKLVPPRDAHFRVAWLRTWHQADRGLVGFERQNGRKPSRKHQTQA